MTGFLQADLGAFQLRFPIEQDRATLGQWLRIDPTDPALIDPDFFLGSGQFGLTNPICGVVADREGAALFLRVSAAARIYFQVAPTISAEERARNRAALRAALPFLETALAAATGRTESILYANTNPALHSFVASDLGFSPVSEVLIKNIARGGTGRGKANGRTP